MNSYGYVLLFVCLFVYLFACLLACLLACLFVCLVIFIYSFVHSCRDTSFKASDAFIGFQKDIPASVIFQATNQLKSAHQTAVHGRFEEKIIRCSGLNPEDLFISDAMKMAVSQYSCINDNYIPLYWLAPPM